MMRSLTLTALLCGIVAASGAMTAPDIAPAPLGTDAACAAPTVSDWTVDGVVNKVNMLPVVGITTTAANSCVTYADSGHATTNTKWGTGMHLFSADLSSIVLNPDESISATMPGSKQYDLDVIVFNPMNGVGSGTTCTIQSGTVQDAGGVPATCALTIDANGMVTAVTITNAGTMYNAVPIVTIGSITNLKPAGAIDATAAAYIIDGIVSSIIITEAGYGLNPVAGAQQSVYDSGDFTLEKATSKSGKEYQIINAEYSDMKGSSAMCDSMPNCMCMTAVDAALNDPAGGCACVGTWRRWTIKLSNLAKSTCLSTDPLYLSFKSEGNMMTSRNVMATLVSKNAIPTVPLATPVTMQMNMNDERRAKIGLPMSTTSDKAFVNDMLTVTYETHVGAAWNCNNDGSTSCDCADKEICSVSIDSNFMDRYTTMPPYLMASEPMRGLKVGTAVTLSTAGVYPAGTLYACEPTVDVTDTNYPDSGSTSYDNKDSPLTSMVIQDAGYGYVAGKFDLSISNKSLGNCKLYHGAGVFAHTSMNTVHNSGTFDATGTGWSVVLGTNGEVTNVRFTREVNTPLDYPYGTTYDCNSAATTASPGMITLTPHVGLEMFIVTFGGNGYTGTATDDKPGVSVGGSCSGYASTVTLLNGQISTIALTAGMEGKDCDTGDTYSTSNGAGGLYDANTNDKVLPVFIGDQAVGAITITAGGTGYVVADVWTVAWSSSTGLLAGLSTTGFSTAAFEGRRPTVTATYDGTGVMTALTWTDRGNFPVENLDSNAGNTLVFSCAGCSGTGAVVTAVSSFTTRSAANFHKAKAEVTSQKFNKRNAKIVWTSIPSPTKPTFKVTKSKCGTTLTGVSVITPGMGYVAGIGAVTVPAISISGCTPTTASVVALPNDVLEGGMKACDKTGTCVPTLDAAGNVIGVTIGTDGAGAGYIAKPTITKSERGHATSIIVGDMGKGLIDGTDTVMAYTAKSWSEKIDTVVTVANGMVSGVAIDTGANGYGYSNEDAVTFYSRHGLKGTDLTILCGGRDYTAAPVYEVECVGAAWDCFNDDDPHRHHGTVKTEITNGALTKVTIVTRGWGYSGTVKLTEKYDGGGTAAIIKNKDDLLLEHDCINPTGGKVKASEITRGTIKLASTVTTKAVSAISFIDPLVAAGCPAPVGSNGSYLMAFTCATATDPSMVTSATVWSNKNAGTAPTIPTSNTAGQKFTAVHGGLMEKRLEYTSPSYVTLVAGQNIYGGTGKFNCLGTNRPTWYVQTSGVTYSNPIFNSVVSDQGGNDYDIEATVHSSVGRWSHLSVLTYMLNLNGCTELTSNPTLNAPDTMNYVSESKTDYQIDYNMVTSSSTATSMTFTYPMIRSAPYTDTEGWYWALNTMSPTSAQKKSYRGTADFYEREPPFTVAASGSINYGVAVASVQITATTYPLCSAQTSFTLTPMIVDYNLVADASTRTFQASWYCNYVSTSKSKSVTLALTDAAAFEGTLSAGFNSMTGNSWENLKAMSGTPMMTNTLTMNSNDPWNNGINVGFDQMKDSDVQSGPVNVLIRIMKQWDCGAAVPTVSSVTNFSIMSTSATIECASHEHCQGRMSPGNYTLQGLTPFQANYSDFRVTYSANKDTSRFTYCGLAVNMDASMMANEGGLRCHECMDSSHCPSSQYCSLNRGICTNAMGVEYVCDAMAANKFGTCQMYDAAVLAMPCISTNAADFTMMKMKGFCGESHYYSATHANAAEQGKVRASKWTGFCRNSKCSVCQDGQMGAGNRRCVDGQWADFIAYKQLHEQATGAAAQRSIAQQVGLQSETLDSSEMEKDTVIAGLFFNIIGTILAILTVALLAKIAQGSSKVLPA